MTIGKNHIGCMVYELYIDFYRNKNYLQFSWGDPSTPNHDTDAKKG